MGQAHAGDSDTTHREDGGRHEDGGRRPGRRGGGTAGGSSGGRRRDYGSGRAALLGAAEALLWEIGYEAMSPRDVLRVSGAGQGSLYHHFTGKQDLAATALAKVAGEMISLMAHEIPPDAPPFDRLIRYLEHPRDALAGSRLGRLANEAVMREPSVNAAARPYFTVLADRLAAAAREAISAGDLPADTDADALAATLIAVVEGGFVLALIHRDADRLDAAVRGAVGLLSAASSSTRDHDHRGNPP